MAHEDDSMHRVGKAVRRRVRWTVKGAVLAVVAIAGIALFAFIVMLLWNWLVPELFHGPRLGYWQTAGLLVLCRILFGGFGGGRHGHWRRHHWREHWESLTPEERARLRERFFEHRCGHGTAPAAAAGEGETPHS